MHQWDRNAEQVCVCAATCTRLNINRINTVWLKTFHWLLSLASPGWDGALRLLYQRGIKQPSDDSHETPEGKKKSYLIYLVFIFSHLWVEFCNSVPWFFVFYLVCFELKWDLCCCIFYHRCTQFLTFFSLLYMESAAWRQTYHPPQTAPLCQSALLLQNPKLSSCRATFLLDFFFLLLFQQLLRMCLNSAFTLCDDFPTTRTILLFYFSQNNVREVWLSFVVTMHYEQFTCTVSADQIVSYY